LFELNHCEGLYLGRGVKSVRFTSVAADKPAKFYLNSAPAHTAFANCKVGQDSIKPLEIGSAATANHRIIHKLLVHPSIQTCQLQMGLTQLQTGSVWNTMPPHTHSRRMEAYFYFALQSQQAVCHFLGEASETRHIWVNNEEAVLSPPWSIHSGVGTGSYAFIWGMAGENLEYDDMDFHPPTTLR
jgi:4-deoxy-L-threo-5-hexosulose-uronate ketol-isomerase